MGIFTDIRDSIFGHEGDRQQPAAPQSGQAGTAAAADPAESEMTHVIDVENRLDSLPGAERLNWRTSIVDLMKLIGVPSDDNSLAALASELGRPGYTGSAEDKVWLHRVTMRELSRNGGRVPAEFLD